MLRRPAPATVIALVAVFFSLSGVAFAAKHYVISSKGQISPKVLKALKGNRGKRGAAGPVGPAGPAGAAGAVGAPGPFPATVPSGKTLVGNYNIGGTAAAASALANTSLSFIFSFAKAPTAELVLAGATPPAQCPGNATTPQAQPGFLCVYETQNENSAGVELNAVTPQGATLFTRSTAAGDFFTFGTWAATAP
jgi:hypothetical protein